MLYSVVHVVCSAAGTIILMCNLTLKMAIVADIICMGRWCRGLIYGEVLLKIGSLIGNYLKN